MGGASACFGGASACCGGRAQDNDVQIGEAGAGVGLSVGREGGCEQADKEVESDHGWMVLDAKGSASCKKLLLP